MPVSAIYRPLGCHEDNLHFGCALKNTRKMLDNSGCIRYTYMC